MLRSLRNVLSGTINQVNYNTDTKKSTLSVVSSISQLEAARRDITTENCPYQFGDLRCNKFLSTYNSTVIDYDRDSNTVTLRINDPLDLDPSRYIAGFVLPTSGFNVGVMNDITALDIIDPSTITIRLGETYPSELTIFTALLFTIGCVKTLAACVDNENLPRHRGFPFTPGTRSFVAGSSLVDP
jgi:hypothetical protein